MNVKGIAVDRTSSVPLHRQLAAALREAIRSGRLAARERIYSTREMQTHLGLSRNTIVDAFEQLHAEGYLVTVRGVGTFVADFVPQAPARAQGPGTQAGPASAETRKAFEVQALAENLDVARPFRPGIPALDAFPADVFKRCFKAEDWHSRVLDYPDPQGFEPLRAAIAQRLLQTRGIECSADRIFITNGAQAAFATIARTLLEPRDLAVIEDPCYPNVRAALHAQRIRTLAVPVDQDGIAVEAFARKRARLAYVTPSHQYPSGAVLALDRRFALLEWAQRSDAWILEDDYDSEFNYTGRPQPSLYALAGDARVLYTGTFSKVLSPGLRIAYIVAPSSICAQLRAVHVVSGASPDTFVQAALARFMTGGHFGRHIAKMRKLYDERRAFVAERLHRSGLFSVKDSRAGLHFIAELAPGRRDVDVSARASKAGLIVPALSSYFVSARPRSGLVIGYAATPPAQAKEAVDALEKLV